VPMPRPSWRTSERPGGGGLALAAGWPGRAVLPSAGGSRVVGSDPSSSNGGQTATVLERYVAIEKLVVAFEPDAQLDRRIGQPLGRAEVIALVRRHHRMGIYISPREWF
jgi:hypothetical protein